jgi:hypothetical protein
MPSFNYRKQVIITSKLADRDAETAKRHLEETLKDLKTSPALQKNPSAAALLQLTGKAEEGS